jgi:hypothetical protein
VTAGTAWRRVRGKGAAAAARAVRPQRKGSGPGPPPISGETPPASPSCLRREPRLSNTLSFGAPGAHARSLAGAGRPGAPEACHLRR